MMKTMRNQLPTSVKVFHDPVRLVGFTLTYALLGVLMLRYLTTPGHLSLIWPSAGLALVVLWRGGYRFGLGIFLGTMLGLTVIDISTGAMLAFAANNTLSTSIACAWLNKRTKAHQFSGDMRSGRDFMSLLEAATLGALINSLMGTGILVLGNMTPMTSSLLPLMQWWQSEILGVMLTAPIILIWQRWPGISGLSASRGLEGFLCLALAYLFGARIFLGWHQEFYSPLNHPYWMFLFVTWAATRIGRHSMSLLLMIVAMQGLVGAVQGVGYFGDDVIRSGLNNYWSYMMVLGSVGYALATLITQSRSNAHRMQREMQFSEDIIRSLPGAFFMLNDEGRLLRWNAFLQEGSGYSAEELKYKPVLELIHEEDRPVLESQIELALKGGEGRAEARILSKDGLAFPCQLNGRSTVLDGQTVIVGTGETIARRKKAEAALRESELRYRQLFENINASITIFDLSFTIVMVNECNARMLNRTPEQMVGETLHTLYPERARFFEKRYRELITSRQGGIFEDEFPLLDGLHCFSSYVYPMLDVSGNPTGLQVIAFDISDRKNAERELRRSEELLSLALESTGDDVWDWDIAQDQITHTERWQQIMGYDPDETVPNWHEIVHPDDFDRAMACRQEMFDPKIAKACFELRLRNKQGNWKWLYGCGSLVARDEDGTPLRAVGTLSDITQRKLMEEDLRKNEQMWRFALEGGGDVVCWIWDIHDNNITFSPHYKEMLGYTLEDELSSWESRVHPEDQAMATDNARALKQGLVTFSIIELRVQCKDGSYKYMQARSMVVEHDAEGNPSRVVGTSTDISKLKDQQQQLESIAHFDALTALPNRLLLAYRLQQALAQSQRRAQPLAVAYLDLDGFKAINDTHGHDIGDELLVRVSQRMKMALREGDTLARIGGDEFIAVLVDLDQAQDCKPILERLLEAASTPVSVGNLLLRVSASVGVTLYPGDGQDADELIRHADHAMYQAKHSGKNRYHMFDAEHDAAVKLQHETIARISRGLEQNEFLLLYQPKINMRTGELLGVEALIRWQHPEHGLVPPYHFLPIIDGQATDIVLGEWVIRSVMKQMQQWRKEGLDISVSVNISAYHLQQDRFVSRLTSLLAEHPDVDPSRLELEILESGAFDDMNHVSSVMRSCQNLGMSSSLDDFGTGYSSLSYLKRLPVRYLKIDQGFVKNMLNDPESLAIIDGIIGLARAFRRDVIAEGVESVEHGEILLQLGCELAQGYGIAMPMPAAQLTTWIQNWQSDERRGSWQGMELHRDGRAHAFAEVKHRQLLNNIDQLLAGENECTPLQAEDCDCCQLHDWLHGEGAMRYGNHAEFMKANQLHERMHRLINEFLTAHAAHQLDDVRVLHPEIHASHHELRALLHRMTQRPRLETLV